MLLSNNNKKAACPRRKIKTGYVAANWETFWDLTDPETVSATMMEIYGAAAATAASHCAAAAIADNRHQDYRFWTIARSCIDAAQQRRREVARAQWEASGLSVI